MTAINLTSKFIFITPVWGKVHTSIFLEICIPSMLAKHNLPAIIDKSHIEYLIYTDQTDLQLLESSPAIARLREYIKVDICAIKGNFVDQHAKMSCYHRLSIEMAVKLDAHLVFVSPDLVWSENSISTIYELVMRGYDVIHIIGLRLAFETFIPEIKKYIAQDSTLSIKAGALVELGLKHLHKITYKHFFEEHTDISGGLMPSNLLWSVKDQGILARCFHLHPLVTKPNIKHSNFDSTIDGDMILNLSNEKSYVVTDSEEILVFEISANTHDTAVAGAKSSIEVAAQWATNRINSEHLKLVDHTIRVHVNHIDDKDWISTEQHANNIVAQIISLRSKLLGTYRFSTHIQNLANLKLFTDICLPSLFAPKNLPSFLDINTPSYLILIKSDLAETLEKHPNFLFLKGLLEVVIEEDLGIDSLNFIRYSQYFKDSKTYYVIIPPYSIWANGSLVAIQELIIYGMNNIQTDLINVHARRILPKIKSKIHNKQLNLSQEELSKLIRHHCYRTPNKYTSLVLNNYTPPISEYNVAVNSVLEYPSFCPSHYVQINTRNIGVYYLSLTAPSIAYRFYKIISLFIDSLRKIKRHIWQTR